MRHNPPMPLGEFELIARHFTRPTKRALLGVGDDCALLVPSPGMQLAVSSDLLVEGRHFLSTVPPDALGHKALAVNLSDLAACGAQPLAFTLMLALPSADEAFLRAFSAGLFALADAHGIELVGGDTTAGPLTVGITVLGELPPGSALRRSGAQVGDDLWVSHPHAAPPALAPAWPPPRRSARASCAALRPAASGARPLASQCAEKAARCCRATGNRKRPAAWQPDQS